MNRFGGGFGGYGGGGYGMGGYGVGGMGGPGEVSCRGLITKWRKSSCAKGVPYLDIVIASYDGTCIRHYRIYSHSFHLPRPTRRINLYGNAFILLRDGRRSGPAWITKDVPWSSTWRLLDNTTWATDIELAQREEDPNGRMGQRVVHCFGRSCRSWSNERATQFEASHPLPVIIYRAAMAHVSVDQTSHCQYPTAAKSTTGGDGANIRWDQYRPVQARLRESKMGV